jgi:hypothetical protein
MWHALLGIWKTTLRMKREHMSEDNLEVAETATTATTAAAESFVNEAAVQAQYTAEDIAKARAQEKDKLYPVLDKMKEELAALKKERDEAAALEAERKARRAEREAENAKKKEAELEQEMSFKELLAKKDAEFNEKLEAERQAREAALALLDREREYQELTAYRQQRLESERDNIIPELIDLIQGNNRDEIEQSIADLKEKSARIFDSVAQASQQSRKEMVGARVTAPASGPLDNDPENNLNSPTDIANMSLADYAKNRAKLLGTASNNRGQGLFG